MSIDQMPFASICGAAGGQQEAQPMTPENVDRVLDEVRPFLIADGGNVEVVDVTDGLVSLRLQVGFLQRVNSGTLLYL